MFISISIQTFAKSSRIPSKTIHQSRGYVIFTPRRLSLSGSPTYISGTVLLMRSWFVFFNAQDTRTTAQTLLSGMWAHVLLLPSAGLILMDLVRDGIIRAHLKKANLV